MAATLDRIEALATATLGEVWELCTNHDTDPVELITRVLVSRQKAPNLFHCFLVRFTERIKDRAEVA
jgi:hypothetical protein